MSVRAVKLSRLGLWGPLALLGLLLFSSLGHAAKCPNVQIVLDRSASMSATVLGSGTRWSMATQTINNLVSLADPLRAARIGLLTFPNAGCDSSLKVRPDYGTRLAIASALAALAPSGSTPSGTAIRDTVALSELKDATRKQYIVLLTDGAPGCTGEPDSSTGTVNQIQLGRMGMPSIGTFVVGVGDGFSASERTTLGQMADAGGYPEATSLRYYEGKTASELTTSLQAITEVILRENPSCSDVMPADMAMPTDMAMPADLYMAPGDMKMMPSDMTMTPADMTMTPADMTMTPADMTMTSADMTMPSADMTMTSADMAMTSADMAMMPADLAIVPVGDGGTGGKLFVEWISPREMEQGKSGPAVVRGSGFAVAAPSASVFLEGSAGLYPLSGVLVEDDKTIKVFIPADLAVGSYDVVVKNPDGALARLSGGFAVTAVSAGGCSCDVTGQRPVGTSSLWLGLGLLLLMVRRVRQSQRVRVARAARPARL